MCNYCPISCSNPPNPPQPPPPATHPHPLLRLPQLLLLKTRQDKTHDTFELLKEHLVTQRDTNCSMYLSSSFPRYLCQSKW